LLIVEDVKAFVFPFTSRSACGFFVPIPTLPDPVTIKAVPALVENCATFPVVVVLMTVRTFAAEAGALLNTPVAAKMFVVVRAFEA